MPASSMTVATQERLSVDTATTLNELLQTTVERFPHRPALAHKLSGLFRPITYGELNDEVRTIASALLELGVKKRDRVAILAENGVDWARVDLALLSIGAATVPIYTTLPPNQVGFILRDSGAVMAFTGDPAQYRKITAVRDSLPDLRRVVVFEGEHRPDDLSLDDALALGQARRLSDTEWRDTWTSIASDDMATLIYTSGTTGEPKGVELTHGNFIHAIAAARTFMTWDETDIFLSFLPLCHIYERAMGYYLPISHGSQIAYVEGTTSVERVAKLSVNFLEVKPTVFLGMPRLYEKMKERIEDAASREGEAKRRAFEWAVQVGLRAARAEMRGRRPDAYTRAQRALADNLVYRKIRARLGGRIRLLISAGAPLPPDVMEFFSAVGFTTIEGYGLTETTSLVLANRVGDMRPGTVGVAPEGIEVDLAPDGEIITRSPAVMRGYWNRPEDTAEAIDADGWFHTGDLAEWQEDRFVRITGRKKDLIVLSNGKKVAPQDIEAMLKTSSIITDITLMGDGSQGVVALIVPAFDRMAQELGIPEDKGAIASHPETRRRVKSELDRLSQGLADFERIRKFALMDHEFTIESGELTPTLKVRRHVLAKRYSDILVDLMS